MTIQTGAIQPPLIQCFRHPSGVWNLLSRPRQPGASLRCTPGFIPSCLRHSFRRRAESQADAKHIPSATHHGGQALGARSVKVARNQGSQARATFIAAHRLPPTPDRWSCLYFSESSTTPVQRSSWPFASSPAISGRRCGRSEARAYVAELTRFDRVSAGFAQLVC